MIKSHMHHRRSNSAFEKRTDKASPNVSITDRPSLRNIGRKSPKPAMLRPTGKLFDVPLSMKDLRNSVNSE
jgi:hypothetical protein